MIAFQMETEVLQACLADLPPVQLKGLDLLGQASELLMPAMPREALRDAVLELMAYTDACARSLHRLRDLSPVPLNCPLVEWVL
jgi:hypothetical protein